MELMQDIDHYLKGEPLKTRRDTLGYRAGKFVRRNRRVVGASALMLTLIAGMLAFFTLRLAKARDHANRETAIATAVNRFLSDDLLARSDPFRSGAANESFVEVVSQASPRIDVQFRDEPVVAARLHQTLAKAFDNRSEFPRARQEYGRANDLFKRGEGPLSEDAALVSLQRAAMEARSYERGSLALAKSILREAETSISRISKPREDLAVWLLSTRGVIAIIGNDARSANENFSGALQRAEAISSFDEAARLRIKDTLGFSYIRLGDGAKAESLFRELVEAFSKAGGPDGLNVLRIRIKLSQALLIQGKYADAIKEANLIYPGLVRKLGEDHELTLNLLGMRAASEGSLGMWDEAIRDDLTVYNLAVRKQGPVSFFSIAMLSDAALSQCRAGRYLEGERNARKAFQEAKQAFGPRAGITGGCSYALATCLIDVNRLDEASELLRNIDAKAVAQLNGDSTVDASIALAQGEIASKLWDYSLAQRYAQIAAPAFERPNSEVSARQALARLRKAIERHLGVSR